MEREFRRQKLNARERSDDFIELDAPLAEVLTQVIFELTVLSGDFKVEVVFDNTYRADDGYVLLPQYAVEGKSVHLCSVIPRRGWFRCFLRSLRGR